MSNYILDFEKASSVSNELASKQVSLKINGDLLLIHEQTNETGQFTSPLVGEVDQA